MECLRMRGEKLAVAAPARPSGRDGVMASPTTTGRRGGGGCCMEDAGAAFRHDLARSC